VRSPAELGQRFRAEGRKLTPQRLRIFEVLHGLHHSGDLTHPTADAVHAEAAISQPTLSLKTVYQTLNDLAEMGEIGVIDVGTGAVRYDTTTEGHHHLVCSRCGRVQDVHAEFDRVALPSALRAGFRVTSTEIVFRGECPSCLGDDGGAATSPLTH
jgi:Fe2+ or Zn2+ uptake regulation protein